VWFHVHIAQGGAIEIKVRRAPCQAALAQAGDHREAECGNGSVDERLLAARNLGGRTVGWSGKRCGRRLQQFGAWTDGAGSAVQTWVSGSKAPRRPSGVSTLPRKTWPDAALLPRSSHHTGFA
jgi:hypothetical protein